MTEDIKKIYPTDFPPLLREMTDPPLFLYMRGSLPSFNSKFLTVVGARRYSEYGKNVCRSLISSLAGTDTVIISGLALGIDAIAHRAALDCGLKSIAIPGSGLRNKILYPRTNFPLAIEIINKGGALLSEFEPEFRASLWSFAKRNRIMAGISHATLIIEAEKKSGTLITSRFATEYNREVYAVPGSIFSKNSEGPHMLISLGATPITSGDDLKQALGIKENPVVLLKTYEDCSQDEMSILNLLDSPLSKDILLHKSRFSIHTLNMLITTLELKGYIKESYGEFHRLA